MAGGLPWRVPIMQAPIGPAATPELVAAVSEAGGIGSLGASWTPPDLLREQIRRIRRHTDRPFCVNLVLAFDQEDRLELVLRERVALVSFSWGVRPELVHRAQAAGSLVLVQVGSAAEARAAAAAGCDALIAQGIEAGGHVQGQVGLLELVGEVRRQATLPVIAAGGVADGDGVRTVLGAGAAGAAMGTRFLATPEADVHPGYVRRLLDATSADTVLTELFDGGWPGAPHRVLRYPTHERWERAGRPPSGQRPGEGDVIATVDGRPIARYAADEPRRTTVGEIDAMCLYAGQGVGLIDRVEPAQDVVSRIAAELRRPARRTPAVRRRARNSA